VPELLNTAILKQGCGLITEHRHPETKLLPNYWTPPSWNKAVP
jgi:hypothetical protein